MIILNSKQRTLTIRGRETKFKGGTPEKAFDLLRELVEHSGKIRTKDDILACVWRGRCVTPRSVDQAVMRIRKTLGKDVIKVIPGVGVAVREPDNFMIN